jgi:hypothetical protein
MKLPFVSFRQCLCVFIGSCLLFSFKVNAVRYAIESDVSARAEYNDNIFLTSEPHDSVYALTVIPEAKMVAKEANWETFLNGKLRSNNYSDHNLDSNDVYLDLSGKYQSERNIYSLGGAYYLDSNLRSESADFGITGKRVNREYWNIVPQYTRLLTERLSFTLSFNHADVDYLDAENTGFVPYRLNTLTGSLAYSLTERDRVSFILQGTDYVSKNNAIEYQLFITRLGIEHDFSELWSVNFTIGGSRRNSTNTITQTFDFFGQPITLTEEIDFSDKGYVLDAGLQRKFETGSFSAGISRDNVTNSQGGLNEVNTLRFRFSQKVTSLWKYDFHARYQDINAVSSVTRTSDREVFIIEPRVFYSLSRDWTANASYRYAARKFRSDTSDDRAPHSNRIYLGLTYNFPDISTF